MVKEIITGVGRKEVEREEQLLEEQIFPIIEEGLSNKGYSIVNYYRDELPKKIREQTEKKLKKAIKERDPYALFSPRGFVFMGVGYVWKDGETLPAYIVKDNSTGECVGEIRIEERLVDSWEDIEIYERSVRTSSEKVYPELRQLAEVWEKAIGKEIILLRDIK